MSEWQVTTLGFRYTGKQVHGQEDHVRLPPTLQLLEHACGKPGEASCAGRVRRDATITSAEGTTDAGFQACGSDDPDPPLLSCKAVEDHLFDPTTVSGSGNLQYRIHTHGTRDEGCSTRQRLIETGPSPVGLQAYPSETAVSSAPKVTSTSDTAHISSGLAARLLGHLIESRERAAGLLVIIASVSVDRGESVARERHPFVARPVVRGSSRPSSAPSSKLAQFVERATYIPCQTIISGRTRRRLWQLGQRQVLFRGSHVRKYLAAPGQARKGSAGTGPDGTARHGPAMPARQGMLSARRRSPASHCDSAPPAPVKPTRVFRASCGKVASRHNGWACIASSASAHESTATIGLAEIGVRPLFRMPLPSQFVPRIPGRRLAIGDETRIAGSAVCRSPPRSIPAIENRKLLFAPGNAPSNIQV